MKSNRGICITLLVILSAFLFGNFNGAFAGNSNADRPQLIQSLIAEQTGMFISFY
jgi:hypothetical protein